MTTYDDHPFSGIWPLLEGEDFDKLVADIKANGLHLPILLYRDKVLDGRKRLRACLATGVAPVFATAKAKDCDSALNLVVSMNEHRRHLSFEERAFAAARLANMKEDARTGNRNAVKTTGTAVPTRDPSLGGHKRSIRDAANIMDVSPGSVARARSIIEHDKRTGEGQGLEKAVRQKIESLKSAADRVRPKRVPAVKVKGKQRSLNDIMAERMAIQKASRKLTPKQVDPEFKGTAMEFTAKYGHVQVETAEERARNRFTDWSIAIGHLAKVLEQQEVPKEVDLNWLRSPERAYVARMRAVLPKLKAAVEQAEAMLARAEGALTESVA